MPKYLSGRVKRRDQAYLSTDRYQFLGLEQAEPNLGDSPGLNGSPNIPAGQQYQIVSLIERPGERFWVPIGGGVIPGSISVFEEGSIVGTLNSITQLNFTGNAITASGADLRETTLTLKNSKSFSFTKSLTVTQASSSATGVVKFTTTNSGIVTLTNVSGTFDNTGVLKQDNVAIGQTPNGSGTVVEITGVGVTIRVAPVGNENEVLFVGSDDFSTDTRFSFVDGLLNTGDRITVGVGGTVITTTDTGKVGIGSTTPIAKLDMNVGSAFTAVNVTGTEGQLLLITDDITSGSIFAVNDVSGMPSIDVDATGTIQLAPFGENEFVGIGTTNPTSKLHVVGDTNLAGNLNVTGVSTFQDDIFVGVGATVGFGTTAYFRDNARAVFGNDEDLSIYHAGDHSYIDEFGTGNLRIRSNNFVLVNADRFAVNNGVNNQNIINSTVDGGVILYQGANEKVKTTNEGILVSGGTTTGDFKATGVSTFIGVSTFNSGVGIADSIFHNGDTNTAIRFPDVDTFTVGTAGSERLRITSTGDVGIGSDSTGGARLRVYKDGNNTLLQQWRGSLGSTGERALNLFSPSTDSLTDYYRFQTGNAFKFQVDSIDALCINSDGKVGIGTDSVNAELHVRGNGNVTSFVEAIEGDAILDLSNSGNGNFSGINFTRERGGGQTGRIGGSIFMPSNTSNNEAFLYIQTQSANADAGDTDPLDPNNGVRLKLHGDDGIFSIETGSEERFRIDNNGNVGIGSTIPIAKLDVFGQTELDDLNVSGVSTFVDNIFVGVGATVGFGSTAYFRDNAKAVFGDDEDLEIYHDEEHSVIKDTGTGRLKILTSRLSVKDSNDTNFSIDASPGSFVKLFHSGDGRLTTTEEGILVSGGTTTGDFKATGVSTFTGNIVPATTNSVNIGESVNLQFNKIFANEFIGQINTVQENQEVGNLQVNGISTFIGVSTFADGIHVLSGISTFDGNIDANQNLDVDGTTTLDDTTIDGLLDINAGGQANTFKVEDLTEDRVVIVGTDGELEDSANLTFNGSTLSVGVDLDVDGHTELDDLNVSGFSTFVNNAEFKGNVSIAGTLTYEDVTNVDSIGIITARKDIHVGAGVSAVGVGSFGSLVIAGATTLENASTLSDSLKITTSSGYVEVGSQNTSNAHFYTDRQRFYFNKRVIVDEGIIGSFNEDLVLVTDKTEERVRIKNNTGNVGIGTDSPDQKLHVYNGAGDVTSFVEAIEGDAILDISNTGNGNFSGINFTRQRSTGSVIGGSISMPSDTSSNQALLFIQTQSANAGVGKTGELSDNNGVRLKLASQPNGITPDSAFSIEMGSSEAFRIDVDGNVGIGSTTPIAKLDVFGQTELDDLNVSGVSTFVGVSTFNNQIFTNEISNSGIITSNMIHLTGGTYNSAVDTKTDVGIVMRDDQKIYAMEAGYLRNLIGHNTSDNSIQIGQFNTGIIDDIHLKPGSNGHIILHDGTTSSSNEKLRTTNEGILVSGGTTTRDFRATGVSTFQDDIFVGVGATVGFGSTAYFRDNAKAIFGDDEDLSIYHDGEDSIIEDSGTGSLELHTSTLKIKNSTDTKLFATFNINSVKLYENNNIKFQTTEEGVLVSGGTTTGDFKATGISTHVGFSTFKDGIFVAGVSTFAGNIDAKGNTTLGDDASSDTLTVNATSTFNNNVSITRGTTSSGLTRTLSIGGARNQGNNFASIDLKNYDSDSTPVADYVAARITGTVPPNPNNGGELVFHTSETGSGVSVAERLRINAGGNVGINSSVPIAKLDVFKAYNGLGVGNAAARIYGTDSGVAETGIHFVEKGNNLHASSTSYLMRGISNGNTKFVFGANGNVGIGTSLPEVPLHVVDSSNLLGILSSTTGGANLDLYDDDTQSRIRTVDGRLHLEADKLNQHDDSQIRFTIGNSIKATISAGASFSFNNDTDTYFHRPSANNLAFVTNGEERLRIKSDGNVGIGTDNPNAKLHIGPVDGDTTPHLYLASQNNLYGFRIDTDDLLGGNVPLRIFARANGNDTERIRVKQTGEVGIGTVAPDHHLHVVQKSTDSYGTGVARFEYYDTDDSGGDQHYDARFIPTGTYFKTFVTGSGTDFLIVDADNDAGRHSFAVEGDGGSNKSLTVDSTGLVGIGTDNPQVKLDVRGSLGISAATDTSLRTTISSSSAGLIINHGDNSPTIFQNAGIERVRFEDTGNVGIGTNDPKSQLHVENAIGTATTVIISQQKTYGVGTGTAERARLDLAIRETNTTANNRIFGRIETGPESETTSEVSFLAFSTRNSGSISERLRITSTGILELERGSAKDQAIDIKTTATNGASRIRFVESGTSKGELAYSHNNDQLELVARSGNQIVMFTNGTSEKVRINLDGDLLRGGTGQDIGSASEPWDKVYANEFVGLINTTQENVTTGNLLVTGIATFQGNVSIAGTLTYEDVTNIDSLGIITARTDVHVGAGLSVVGISTFNSNLNVDDINIGQWAGHANYAGVFHKTQTGNEYMLLSQGDHTFLSANSGYDVVIRGGNNTNTNNIRVTPDSDGIQISGNTTFYNDIDVDGTANLDDVDIDGDLDVDGTANLDDVDIDGDLDVDGHTDLDNVNIAGVTTISSQLNLDTTGEGIKFGPGTAANDDAHIEWLGTSNAGYLRISTGDDSDASGANEYIEFGDYKQTNKGGAFTQHLRIARDQFLVRTGSNTITPADRFIIDSEGKIGIKTTILTAQLSIGNTTGGNPSYMNLTGIQVNRPHQLGLQNGVHVYTDNSYNQSADYQAAAFKATAVGGIAFAASTDADSDGLGGTLNARIDFDGDGHFLGNIGIGSANPAARLDVFKAYNGVGSGNAAARIYGIDSGVEETGIRFVEKGTNLHSSSTSYLMRGISDGVTKFVFGANGNVGIGSTTPQVKLDVAGDINVLSKIGWAEFPNASFLDFDDDNSAVPFPTGTNNLTLASISGMNLIYDTNNNDNNGFMIAHGNPNSGLSTPVLVIDENDRVGIGTENPTSYLQVYRKTEFGGNPIIQARSNNGSTNELKFEIDGDGDAYFNGNVGIGTDTPNHHLHVVQKSTSSYGTGVARFEYYDTDDSGGDQHYDAKFIPTGTYIKSFVTGSGTDFLIVDADNALGRASFAVESDGGTERFRVDSTGNVGINSTAPIAKLDVFGQTELDDLNVSGISTFAGITTVTGQTLFTKQLNVAGISTFNDNAIIDGSLTVGSNHNLITGGAPTDQGNLAVYGVGKNSLIIQATNNGTDRGIAWRNAGDAYVAYISAVNRGSSQADLKFGVSNNNSNVDLIFERMRITKEGNVGIGTTNPIASNINTALQNNTTTLAVGVVTAREYFGTFKGTVDTDAAITNANNVNITNDEDIGNVTHYIHFGDATSGYDGVKVDSTGLVYKDSQFGLGTDDPDAPLHILSAVDTLGILSSTDSGANLDLYDNDTQSRIRTVDGILRLEADKLNNVDNSEIRFVIDGGRKVGITSEAHLYFGSDTDTYLHRPAANNLVFVTNGEERLRIKGGGNVGIGTDNPDQKLHVHKGSAGAVNSDGNAVITLENNNHSVLQILSPTDKSGRIMFGDPDDTNAGQISYDHNIDALSVQVNGGEKARITGFGSFGLGTNDPTKKLDIVGFGTDNGIRVGDSHFYAFSDDDVSTKGSPTFRNLNNNANTILRVIPNGTGKAQFEFFANDFYSNTTSWKNLRILADPSNDYISVNTAAASAVSGSSKHLVFETEYLDNGTVRSNPNQLFLKNNGSIGIGTTNPQQLLHVETLDSTARIHIERKTGGGVAGLVLKNTNKEYHVQLNSNAFQIFDKTATTERFRITSDGDVGVGTQFPSTKLEVLEKSDNTYGDGVARFKYFEEDENALRLDVLFKTAGSYHKTFATGAGTDFLIVDADNVAGRHSFAVEGNAGNVKSFTVDSTGLVGVKTNDPQYDLHVIGTAAATNFDSLSDRKVKTNIKIIQDPIDKIKKIDGVSFNWKSDNKPSLGVIADNVEEVLPEIVSGNDPKSVNYNGLIGLLIEVVKDQQKQIDELRGLLDK